MSPDAPALRFQSQAWYTNHYSQYKIASLGELGTRATPDMRHGTPKRLSELENIGLLTTNRF